MERETRDSRNPIDEHLDPDKTINLNLAGINKTMVTQSNEKGEDSLTNNLAEDLITPEKIIVPVIKTHDIGDRNESGKKSMLDKMRKY